MRTIRLIENGKPPLVVAAQAAEPQPGPGELLIRVRAAGFMPAELSWYPTTHLKTGGIRKCAVPGHEFSGVVARVGKDVGSLAVGHEVFGMNDWYSDGAMADYCIAPFFAVAAKPGTITHIEAASVPIGALTAWQGLFDHARLRPGERVLIHGGAGAVGLFAVQLARLHGARVMATASAADCEFVSSLGAERVIDYEKSRFEDFAREVDVVFDTVGGETLERSWPLLSGRGRMVTIVSTEAESPDPKVQQAFFIVEPNQKQLVEISRLIDGGQLRVVVGGVIPLSQAPEAYAGAMRKEGRGRLVIAVGSLN
jgi:NADPH:quinone reductase-like Zn-dependent oxidoreductase